MRRYAERLQERAATLDLPAELRAMEEGRPSSTPPVNPVGGSGTDEGRDSWCTPLWLADVISGDYEIDLDPCSNDRSHILAKTAVCYTPDGQNDGLPDRAHGWYIKSGRAYQATATTRGFYNPPYARNQVVRWVKHYRHTDFIFLLRWAPDTVWYNELWPHCWGAWFPKKCDANPSGRINFEPPPGISSSSNPFPHALYLKSAPTGKFLDRLLATGYLVANYARQEQTRPGEGADNSVGAAGGGTGGNGATAAQSPFSGINRTVAPPLHYSIAWAGAGLPEPDAQWFLATGSPASEDPPF